MLSANAPTTQPPSRHPTVEIIAVIFFLMSFITFALLVAWVLSNETVLDGSQPLPMTLWMLFSTIGLIRPMLILFAAGVFLRLSLRLRMGEMGAVRWALMIYNWLVVIGVGITLYAGFVTPADLDLNTRDQFLRAFPWLLGTGIIIGIRRFITLNHHRFSGDEDLIAKNTRIAWNLLTPTLIVFMLIAVTPLERVFITSLTDERFASSDQPTFVGLDNYNRLWSVRLDIIPCETDADGVCLTETAPDGTEQIVYPRARRYFQAIEETGVEESYTALRYRDMATFALFGEHLVISARDIEFVQSVITSVQYTIFAIALQFTIGFFMAMIIAQRVRGIGILRVVMLVPMAIPTLIATQFWDVMLRPDETGLINAMLLNLGFISDPQQWLLDPALQIPTLVAVIVWKETPITALLMLPGLLAIPREVYQAAAIDGANRWQRFWAITMPMMRPTIGVTLVLRTMLFLRVFDLFEILVGRTRFVMATYAHDALIQRQQLGYSSAISVTIFIVTMLFTIAYMRTLRIDEA